MDSHNQFENTSFIEDILAGLIDKDIKTAGTFSPRLISNQSGNTMSDALNEEISTSETFDISVAFITEEAILTLLQAFIDHKEKIDNSLPPATKPATQSQTAQLQTTQSVGRIITSTKGFFNTPNTFRQLLKLKKDNNIDVRIWSHDLSQNTHSTSPSSIANHASQLSTGESFHPKGYIFTHHNNAAGSDPYYNIYIGSSNLTAPALHTQREWNLRISSSNNGDLIKQIQNELSSQVISSEPLNEDWIKQYEEDFKRFAPPREVLLREYEQSQQNITPNDMQKEALQSLQALRDKGEHRAIIISATGTGKTYLSALDVKQFQPKRMLYVAHQQQILEKAIQSYITVLQCNEEQCGLLSGTSKAFDKQYVFATIQTLSQPEVLQQFKPDEFDYILIDEVHHAGAASYKRVIDYFSQAQFMLGMTATPERTDGINIFSLFGHNIAYEIRLQRALEQNMLCPFHYYGIAEYLGTKTEIQYEISQLASPKRVRYIIDKLEQYSSASQPVTGIVFCSSIEEAQALSTLFNTHINQQAERNFRTKAVTGKTPVIELNQAIRELEQGKLDYIFTVNLFNEGIDIPAINQIVMLRNTKSSIIFTQQLGRGLRKFPGKESVIVIDFIGNYLNNFLIPVALYGNTGDRDIARKNMQQHSIGLSSISFDPIAKERVLSSLDSADWSEMKKLTEHYRQLRFQLGRIPMLADIFAHDSSLALTIALKKNNYLEFVQSREKSITEKLAYEQIPLKQIMQPLSPQQLGVLSLVTQHLLPGLRPHELVILDMLCSKSNSYTQTITYEDIAQELSKRYPSASTDEAHITSALHVLDLSFFLNGTQQRYGNTPLIQMSSDTDENTAVADTTITLSNELQQFLENEVFRYFFNDTIRTGLKHYDVLLQNFTNRLRTFERGFLYEQKYRLVDVFRLLCVGKEPNPQNVGGYAQPGNNDFMPIFVKYASSQYEDTFTSPQDLFYYSKNKRTMQSPEFKWIMNTVPDKTWAETHFVPLFVMRRAEAKEARYYYVGHVSAVNGMKETTKPSASDPTKQEKVVTANLHLEQPLDMELFRHIIG